MQIRVSFILKLLNEFVKGSVKGCGWNSIAKRKSCLRGRASVPLLQGLGGWWIVGIGLLRGLPSCCYFLGECVFLLFCLIRRSTCFAFPKDVRPPPPLVYTSIYLSLYSLSLSLSLYVYIYIYIYIHEPTRCTYA